MRYWLMKSEPESYGWDDLVRDGETEWDGVRNNAAQSHLRTMSEGDRALFYHSGDEKAAVGVMTVASAPHADPNDADWTAVRVKPLEPLARPVTLAAMKAEPGLADMATLRQSRLSVSPVTAEEWALLLEMGG